MTPIDEVLEAYATAQDWLAHILAKRLAERIEAWSGEKSPTERELVNALAGETALPVATIRRLLAYQCYGREAQNGVLPEVYGAIIFALRKTPERTGAMLDAAETARWNLDTALVQCRVAREKHRVEKDSARSALEHARTIVGGEITAGTVLALPESDRIELSKPLRIVARYCGQGGGE